MSTILTVEGKCRQHRRQKELPDDTWLMSSLPFAKKIPNVLIHIFLYGLVWGMRCGTQKSYIIYSSESKLFHFRP